MLKPLLAAGAAACLLSACSTVNGGALADKALGNLEHCKRVYQATVGALGAPGGSLFIQCEPKPFDAPPPGMSDLKVVVEP